MTPRRSSLVAALAVGLFAQNAAAYCRSLACKESVDCTRFYPDGTPITCPPVFWENTCVSYAVHSAGSPRNELSADALAERVRRAFDTWLAASCGEGSPLLIVSYDGISTCRETVFDLKTKNANVWMVYDTAWPHMSDSLALTTTTFNTETGELLGADVEINAQDHDYSAGQANLDYVILHEAGHFLGLDHSSDPTAVMFTTYGLGVGAVVQQPTLNADDVAGICEIHGKPHAISLTCEPRNGFGAGCREPMEETSSCGCRVVGRSAGETWSLALLGVAGLGALGRRWRRQRVP
jgi:hypothetical protein